MPKIFKALASIAAWILFIVGCLGILLPLFPRIITGDLFSSITALNTGVYALLFSVVCMKLRHWME